MTIELKEISEGYTPEEFNVTLEEWVRLSKQDPKYKPIPIHRFTSNHPWGDRIYLGPKNSPLVPTVASRISEMYELTMILGSAANSLDLLPADNRSAYLRDCERMKIGIGRLMMMIDSDNPYLSSLFRSAAFDHMRADLMDGSISFGRHQTVRCLIQAGLTTDAIYASTGLRLIKDPPDQPNCYS